MSEETDFFAVLLYSDIQCERKTILSILAVINKAVADFGLIVHVI